MSFKVDYQNGQRFVDKLTPQLERKIVAEYSGALKELRATMAEYYAKYPMTYQEMAKYKRLEKLEAELKVIIVNLNRRLERATTKGLEDIYTNSYNILGYALENNTQFAWAMPPQRAVVEAINNPVNGHDIIDALKTNRDYVINQVNQTVTRGLIRGDSYKDMATQLKGSLENNVNRYALRIVRTEAHKVQSIAQQDSFDYAESKGIKGRKVWISTLDSRTRPDHQDMDGVEADEDGMFTLPDGSRGEQPGMIDDYSQNVNCFAGDTLIVPHSVEKIYKRKYVGEMYSIETAFGTKFTVTPNHPVRTEKGWVPVHFLNKGDNIVGVSFGKVGDIVDVDIKYRPVSIAKMFNFFNISFSRKRRAGSNKQFHGDGLNGDVDIILSESELLDSRESSRYEHIVKRILTFPNILLVALFSLSSLVKFLFRPFSTTNGFIGLLRKPLSFFKRSVGHSNKHSFTSVSGRNTILEQETSNDVPRDIVSLCKSFFGDSSEIVLDEIVNITKFNFCGHVYNLQTYTGDYIVAGNKQKHNGNMGIVVSNCRCSSMFIIDEVPEVRRTKKGIETYKTYKEWANK